MTGDELALLRHFRGLTEADQAALLTIAAGAAARSAQAKVPAAIDSG